MKPRIIHEELICTRAALAEMLLLPIHAWPNEGDDPLHPYPQDSVAAILKHRNRRIPELMKEIERLEIEERADATRKR